MTIRQRELDTIRDDDVLAARLLDRIAGGDRAAMDHFYGIHEAGIYRLALAVLDDAHAATRVLVSVMLFVWHHAAALRIQGSIRTALLARTLGEARAWVAADRDQGATGHPGEHAFHGGSDGALLLDRANDVLRVQAALHRLPPQHRAALHLAYCENLDHDGIAHVLGCPSHVVAALQTSAREMLEQQLAA